MSFYSYHANAIARRSLNLGASASFVPLNTTLITNPVNSDRLSAVNWYSKNSPSVLDPTFASGLPLF